MLLEHGPRLLFREATHIIERRLTCLLRFIDVRGCNGKCIAGLCEQFAAARRGGRENQTKGLRVAQCVAFSTEMFRRMRWPSPG